MTKRKRYTGRTVSDMLQSVSTSQTLSTEPVPSQQPMQQPSPAVSSHPPAVSHPSPAVSSHPSTVSRPPPVVSSPPPAVSCPLPAVSSHPPSQPVLSGPSGPSGTESSSSSSKKGRGLALGIRDWGGDNFKYHVVFDKMWCPIEEKKRNKLSGQLGVLVRRNIPLIYTDWAQVPLHLIEQIWEDVKRNLEPCPDQYKPVCLEKCRQLWKDHKYHTKKNYFTPYRHILDRYPDCPHSVRPEHWRELVDFWRTEYATEIAQKNSRNRELRGPPHNTGKTPFFVIRHEMEAAGERTDKMSVYLKTRRADDPDLVPYIVEFNRLMEEVPEDARTDDARNKIFHQVFGEDGHGYCRTYGTGILPDAVYGERVGPSQLHTEPAVVEEITRQVTMTVTEDLKEKLREELRDEITREVTMQLMKAGVVSIHGTREVPDASSGHQVRHESVGDDAIPDRYASLPRSASVPSPPEQAN